MLAYSLLADFFRQSITSDSQDDLVVVEVAPNALFKHGCYP
jgi:hypothetical protein